MADYALAGAGWISAVHGLAIAAQRDSRVVAVASRTRQTADARAVEVGGVVVPYDQLPAGADIVIVATPPRRHAVDALRAMAAGAATVVEKPLCATLDDADRLVRVVEAGGMLTYAENLLFAEAPSRALSEIATLGTLTHLSARAMQPRPTWGSFTERSWGGGVLFDLGVHPLALVLRAARSARPVAVSAAFERSDDIEVEDRASVQLRFDNGLVAQVEVSWRESDTIWDLQAASESGVVVLELLPELSLERGGEPIELPPPPVDVEYPPQLDQFGYVEQLRDAEASAKVGRSSAISDVYLGRDLLEIVCAASMSAARSSIEIPLPYTGPRDKTPIELWDPQD
ncbi:Gfo/Idh/MocA family protein [Actinospongicola halichondriae]|uniref:Gfo/Idh/MocA family protein n=1 Tax=Actinospongicola halichondriae TaxID=3236844 RepID=UPI003D5975EF